MLLVGEAAGARHGMYGIWNGANTISPIVRVSGETPREHELGADNAVSGVGTENVVAEELESDENEEMKEGGSEEGKEEEKEEEENGVDNDRGVEMVDK